MSLIPTLGRIALAGGLIILASQHARAAPFTIDGMLDPGEGYTQTATVSYDPNAPTSNFGAPTGSSNAAAYTIYQAIDSTYLYGLLIANNSGGGAPVVPPFANLYFGTGASATSGSDVGFEITNGRAFTPGGPNDYAAVAGLQFATTANSVEYEIPLSVFTAGSITGPDANNNGMPYTVTFDPVTAANPTIELRLSQSFGYSVAGGAAAYGPNRLGVETVAFASTNVPEPASLALLGAGLVGIGLLRQRRQA